MRLVPGLALGAAAATALDGWYYRRLDPWLPGSGGWYLYHDCGTRPGAPPYVLSQGYYGPRIRTAGSNTFPGCVAGQSMTGAIDAFAGIPANIPSIARTIFLYDVGLTAGTQRGRIDLVWWRSTTGPSPAFRFNPVGFAPAPWSMPDPNVMRGAPGTPPEPAPPTPGAVPPAPAPAPLPPAWGWTPGGGFRPPQHVRQPPGGNARDRKNVSRAAKIGRFLWGLLDTASELSEIGGAFWDALPEEIRERYGCTDAVSIGQYGFDLTTCKGRALWENWDQIDTAEAFKNLAKNVVEDMTIGQFHRWLSKMYPPGVSFQKTAATTALSKLQPEAYIAARLKELWEFLGI